MQVIYTGYFVDDTASLLDKIDIALGGSDIKVYAHHITKKFRPANGTDDIEIGKKYIFSAYAQVITNRVQALLVRCDELEKISDNAYPHLTIATCDGASPAESNQAIEAAHQNGTIIALPQEIKIAVTEGYFDGEAVHIS